MAPPMKWTGVALAIAAAAPLATASVVATREQPHDAAKAASLLATSQEMIPTIEHGKVASGGYTSDSPLYHKWHGKHGSGDSGSWWPWDWSFSWPKLGSWEWPWVSAHHRFLSWGFQGWGGFILFLLTMIIAGLFYVNVVGRSVPVSPYTTFSSSNLPGYAGTTRSFSYGLFQFQNCGIKAHRMICLCSFCCTSVRWADTVSKEPFPYFLAFWPALLIFAVLAGLGSITSGLTSCIILPLMGCFFRQKLRQAYNIENNGGKMCMDLLAWCCCPCCAAAQEALQVDFIPRPQTQLMSGLHVNKV